MSLDGYTVDLEALYKACLSLRRLFDDMASHPVRDLEDPTHFGHARLSSVTTEFCDRWQRGVKNLLEDGRAIEDQLRETVSSYQSVEEDAVRVFTELFDQSMEGAGGND
jgi:hypothetical protein